MAGIISLLFTPLHCFPQIPNSFESLNMWPVFVCVCVSFIKSLELMTEGKGKFYLLG